MRELRRQLAAGLLMIVMVAAVVAAAINFNQQRKFHLPDDGVTWVDRLVMDDKRPVAAYVAPGSAAEQWGIRKDDLLVSIDNRPIAHASDAARVIAQLGVLQKAN